MTNTKEFPLCPICGEQTYGCYDEWGKTMLHIHCDKCRINVGGPLSDKTVEEFLSFANNMKEKHYKENSSIKGKYFFEYSVGLVSIRK